MTLMEQQSWLTPFETRGQWFLPGRDSASVGGTLSYDPRRGIVIRLDGVLLEPRSRSAIVHGHTTTLGDVTLLGVTDAGCQFSTAAAQDLNTMGLITGVLAAEVDLNAVRGVWVEFDGLASVLAHDRWKLSTRKGDPPLRLLPEMRIGGISVPGGRLSLRISTNFTSNWGSLRLETRCAFHLTGSTPQPLDWYEDRAASIGLLLAVLVGQPVVRNRFSLDAPGRHACERPRLYRTMSVADVKPLSGLSHNLATALHARTMKPIIERWFNLEGTLRGPAAILVEQWFRPLITEFAYSALVQAAEAYHRIRYDGADCFIGQKEYNKQAKKIRHAASDIVGVDPKYRDLLEAIVERVNGANEWQLYRRLEHLVSRLPAPIQSAVACRPDWCRDVARVRNNLTHQATKKGKDPVELVYDVRRLMLLLNSVILQDLGIAVDDHVIGDWGFSTNYGWLLAAARTKPQT